MAEPTPALDFRQLYESLFVHDPEGVILGRLDGSLVRANPAACRMLGMDDERLLRSHRDRIVVDRDAARAIARERGERGVAAGRLELRRADGSTFPVDLTSALIPAGAAGGEPLTYTIFRDATEQVRAERSLREGEQVFRELFRRVPVPLAFNDASGRILALNEAFGRVVGYTAGEIPTTADWFPRAYPDPAYRAEVAARWGAALERANATGKPVPPEEYDVVVKSGERRTMLISAARVGENLLVALEDVTDRRRAEERLQRSEFLYRTIVDHYPAGMFALWGPDMRILIAGGARSGRGYTAEDLVGKLPADYAPPDAAGKLEACCREALAGRTSLVELQLGSQIFEVSTVPVRDARGVVVMGLSVSEDVTERRRLQAQMAVTSRLTALGTLVAGIGHEVNNPLTGALASEALAAEAVDGLLARLAAGEAVGGDDLRRSLEEIAETIRDARQGTERVTSIVRDFTAFGRSEGRRVPVRLADVVESAMRWLPITVAGVAAIRVERQEVGPVVASSGQLQQVLVNLATNAAKSIPAGRKGTIVVRLGPAEGGKAFLEVRDDGMGMSPEVLDRVFDPFFTTRKTGEGMGLGLAISHAIVTAHGGTLTAASTPGEGSTFRVELPLAG